MKYYLHTTLILCVLFSPVSCVLGQDQSWIDTSRHKGLIEIDSDYPFKYLVSNKDILPSEATLQNLSNSKKYLDSLFGIDIQFAALFIENSKWMQHAYFPPPGMPQGWRGNIILGVGNSVMATNMKQVISGLPDKAQEQLKEVYGSDLDFDLFYRESLGLHELGHLYQFKDASQPQRKWLSELFATMCMYACVKSQCERCYNYMNALPEFILRRGDENIEFKKLNDFEEKYIQGMSPQNYGWYQMNLYAAAKKIVDHSNSTILIKLRDFLIETDLSQTARLSDKDLGIALEEKVGKDVSDVLTKWKYQ